MNIFYWSAPRTECRAKYGVTREKKVALEILRVILESKEERYKGHLYKIGITGNPQLRSYGHHEVVVDEEEFGPDLKRLVVQKGLWDRMHVIFQAMGGPEIRQAERDLIKFALDTYGGVSRERQKPDQVVFSFNENPG